MKLLSSVVSSNILAGAHLLVAPLVNMIITINRKVKKQPSLIDHFQNASFRNV